MIGVLDPGALQRYFWPQVTFTQEQWSIIYSVWDDDRTYVRAGNKLGKDFVAGFIVVAYFLSRHPCKIITTSVKDKHLEVLWTEVEKFLRISKYPLLKGEKREVDGVTYVGNQFVLNADGMRKIVNGTIHKGSYVMKLVANDETIESFQGHHVTPDPGQPIDNVPRNLIIGDESSGLKDAYYDMAKTCFKRMLWFGNCWPCETFFKKAFKGDPSVDDPGGNIPRDNGKGYHRRCITIKGEDSPNVVLGMLQKSRGETPDDEVLVPGVKTYSEYMLDRRFLDEADQCVILDSDWYAGPDIMLFPQEWLDRAFETADELVKKYGKLRKGKTLGIDTAEGGDNTAMTIADDMGLIYQQAKKTRDTSVIPDEVLSLMREFSVPAEGVLFDIGGGGKEQADVMRRRGYNVGTISFGNIKQDLRRGMSPLAVRKTQREEQETYTSRRIEMYCRLSQAINPINPPYGIPSWMTRLIFQLKKIPKGRDSEGRLWIPPKRKSDKTDKSNQKTLTELIGYSPDEADSAVMAYYATVRKVYRPTAGAVV